MIHTSSEETYKDGEIIFEEGSSGDWVYIVESGAVELYKHMEGKKMVLEVLRAGEIFGELAFIAGTRRTASARALGDTVVGIMDRAWLDEEYNRMSSGFRSLLRSLALRLKKTTDTMVGLTNTRQEQRIPLKFPVEYIHKDRRYKATALNAGRSGMFISTPEPLEEGESFMALLPRAQGQNPLEIKCVVAWTRSAGTAPNAQPPGMGVKFLKISADDLKWLERIIAK